MVLVVPAVLFRHSSVTAWYFAREDCRMRILRKKTKKGDVKMSPKPLSL